MARRAEYYFSVWRKSGGSEGIEQQLDAFRSGDAREVADLLLDILNGEWELALKLLDAPNEWVPWGSGEEFYKLQFEAVGKEGCHVSG